MSILSGYWLTRVMKERKALFSVLDKSNPSFCELMLTLDGVTSELHFDGVGVSKKSAAIVTFEHEAILCVVRLLDFYIPKDPLYNTEISEKILSDISGHKRIEALCAFERASTTQQKTVGESLNSGKVFVEKENTPATCSAPKPSLALLMLALMTGKL